MPPPLRIETTKPLILAGRNKTYKIGPDPGMKEQWALFMEDFGKITGQVGYLAYGVCHNFDGQGHMDYLCAAEVKDEGQVPGYLATLVIPARRTAVFVHYRHCPFPVCSRHRGGRPGDLDSVREAASENKITGEGHE